MNCRQQPAALKHSCFVYQVHSVTQGFIFQEIWEQNAFINNAPWRHIYRQRAHTHTHTPSSTRCLTQSCGGPVIHPPLPSLHLKTEKKRGVEGLKQVLSQQVVSSQHVGQTCCHAVSRKSVLKAKAGHGSKLSSKMK